MSYTPPPPPPSMPPPGVPGQVPPSSNQKALWSMILGIVSVVCCGFLAGIPAVILANMAKKEIDASGGTQGGLGMAKAGLILGIIGIVLGVLLLALYAAGIAAMDFTTSP